MSIESNSLVVTGSNRLARASILARGSKVMCVYGSRCQVAYVDSVKRRMADGMINIVTQNGRLWLSSDTPIAIHSGIIRWKEASFVKPGMEVRVVEDGIVALSEVQATFITEEQKEVIDLVIDGKCKNYIAEGFVLRGAP